MKLFVFLLVFLIEGFSMSQGTQSTTHQDLKEEGKVILNLFKHKYGYYGEDLIGKLEQDKASLEKLSAEKMVTYVKIYAQRKLLDLAYPSLYKFLRGEETLKDQKIARVTVFLPQHNPEQTIVAHLMAAAYCPMSQELEWDRSPNDKYWKHAFIQSTCAVHYAPHPLAQDILNLHVDTVVGQEDASFIYEWVKALPQEETLEAYCLYFPRPSYERNIQEEEAYYKALPTSGDTEEEYMVIKEEFYRKGRMILEKGPLAYLDPQPKITQYFKPLPKKTF